MSGVEQGPDSNISADNKILRWELDDLERCTEGRLDADNVKFDLSVGTIKRIIKAAKLGLNYERLKKRLGEAREERDEKDRALEKKDQELARKDERVDSLEEELVREIQEKREENTELILAGSELVHALDELLASTQSVEVYTVGTGGIGRNPYDSGAAETANEALNTHGDIFLRLEEELTESDENGRESDSAA